MNLNVIARNRNSENLTIIYINMWKKVKYSYEKQFQLIVYQEFKFTY